ncbi:MAG: PQQ-binding-like beta-propeller repeat protein [Chloroflexi bacterium]|nr:PQQ-binding-like beta-propeller repeat protein [Chloroflexota bacterium]
MKTKYLVLIGLLLALAVVLGGCATGLTASSWPGVTADADNAYIAGGPYVYAVNLQTGAEVWRFPAKAATATPFYATPKLTPDGQLIVGSFDHKLYSLNPQSGAENWRFEQAKDRWIGGVLITNDSIYAINADYNLYALTFTGTLKWVSPFQADQAIWGSPVSDGTNVYFGTLGRHVYAVNVQTGKQTWMQTVDGGILGSPVLGSNNSLYLGTHSGVLVALNARNGEIIQQETTSSWIWSGPAQDGTNVYVGDANGMFYAFPMTGTGQPWTQQLNGTIVGSPLVSGSTIVVGTESGNVYFMDNTGQNARPVSVSGKIYATPVAAGTLVLVAPTGGDNLLVALDQSGATKWSFTPAK